MVFLWELISDLTRVEQGWWNKDTDGVWQFLVAEDRLSKGMKIKEGESQSTTREKVIKELHIDSTIEDIELTYQMPSWMDVDGSVKPVPIHIRTDNDLDMFLEMRVYLRELKLYVVPMAKGMTLDVEDYRVVKPTHGFASAETVRGSEYDREKAILEEAYDGRCVLLTQKGQEVGESSNKQYKKVMVYGPKCNDVDLHMNINRFISGDGSSESVFPDSASSNEESASGGQKRLRKELLPLFESEVAASQPRPGDQNEGNAVPMEAQGPMPSQGTDGNLCRFDNPFSS